MSTNHIEDSRVKDNILHTLRGLQKRSKMYCRTAESMEETAWMLMSVLFVVEGKDNPVRTVTEKFRRANKFWSSVGIAKNAVDKAVERGTVKPGSEEAEQLQREVVLKWIAYVMNENGVSLRE